MNSPQKCAALIKQLAKQNKISVSKLLAECGLTKSLIYDMEKRNSMPSADKIAKIADCFHVPVDYLLTGEELQKEKPPAKTVGGDIDHLYPDILPAHTKLKKLIDDKLTEEGCIMTMGYIAGLQQSNPEYLIDTAARAANKQA